MSIFTHFISGLEQFHGYDKYKEDRRGLGLNNNTVPTKIGISETFQKICRIQDGNATERV